MTRRRKVVTVGGILLLGFLLAWPFRKSAVEATPGAEPQQLPVDTMRASNGDPIAKLGPLSDVASAPTQLTVQAASATLAGMAAEQKDRLESFDIANHPALSESERSLATSPTTIPVGPDATAHPAYDTANMPLPTSLNNWPAELTHIVVNGDTLEKLAERYLNDPGRALEIFDLNRDQLSNPHLLPIGIELRVPQNPDRIHD